MTTMRFDDAVAANSADLLAYLERRLPADDAAEAFGDLLLTAWRRVADLPDDPERARMWLFVVARNLLANAQRTRRRRDRLTARLGDELRSTAPAPDDDALAVRHAVEMLPPDERELIRLAHWDGFSIVAAAELTGVSEATARRRYSAARSALRVSLGESQYTAVSP